LWSYEEES
jgi:PAS domain-containing protein